MAASVSLTHVKLYRNAYLNLDKLGFDSVGGHGLHPHFRPSGPKCLLAKCIQNGAMGAPVPLSLEWFPSKSKVRFSHTKFLREERKDFSYNRVKTSKVMGK